jgi:ribosomal protein S18 acetylase RimI-like enzyme
MTFLTKARRVLSEAAAQRRGQGNAAAARYLARHLYGRSTMVLFECRTKRTGGELPTGFRIVQVGRNQRDAFAAAIDEAGAGSDISNFERGADCWLLLDGERGAAVGWRFWASPLFRPLGYDPARTIYLGGYHVRPEYRGRGLYPLLVERMFAASEAADCALAETAPDNVSSQRGLVKAGFIRRGLLHRLVLGGRLVRCTLEA